MSGGYKLIVVTGGSNWQDRRRLAKFVEQRNERNRSGKIFVPSKA